MAFRHRSSSKEKWFWCCFPNTSRSSLQTCYNQHQIEFFFIKSFFYLTITHYNYFFCWQQKFYVVFLFKIDPVREVKNKNDFTFIFVLFLQFYSFVSFFYSLLSSISIKLGFWPLIYISLEKDCEPTFASADSLKLQI